MNQKQIISFLQDNYKAIFRKEAPDSEENLLNLSLTTNTIYYLYWFQAIDDYYGISIEKEIAESSYEIMTIKNIAILISKKMTAVFDCNKE